MKILFELLHYKSQMTTAMGENDLAPFQPQQMTTAFSSSFKISLYPVFRED